MTATNTLPATVDDNEHQQLPARSTSRVSMMMDISAFEHLQRVCKVYASSSMVPQQFQNRIDNCMIAFELAHRLDVDVFTLMQAMYVVSGRPGLEAKLVISLVNKRGPFRGPIQYEMKRDPEGRVVACTAFATHKATGERCEVTITKDIVSKEGWDKKGGSKWLTMPEQMYRYRSAAWLARAFCPEVIMGMHTTDELEDTYGDTRYIQSTSRPVGTAASMTKILEAKTDDAPADKQPEPEAQQPDQQTVDAREYPAHVAKVIDKLAAREGIDFAVAAGHLATAASKPLIGCADLYSATVAQAKVLGELVEKGDI